ncbi:carboxypeptidase-like regulatory domain-containing protein [Prolixibacteraceae bacterium Z1-6]|uniref:Carboxypeptidase-like regulatory domain-containing protein n=2 Tax=Draconibacterium aestuarii TaxID=2998507 RepID=A0A9X3J812_9BACT|nr:carboxypeptidase-like regulatory domain-containing protein [Prolixibacteraceae bacterium Z1-6]
MRKVLIAALLIISVVVVNAKESDTKTKTNDTENTATMLLSGSIADELSGESLVGVEVKIEGTDLKTYTDFDGNFSFQNVKPGEYKLVANYISYEKKSEVLKVDSKGNDIKIKLQSSN